MLDKTFDITIARFPTLQDVDREEILQADIVQIDEYLPEGIYHSSQLNWKGDLRFFESPEQFIRSEKERKNLEQNRQYFLDHGYEIKTVEMTEASAVEFYEVYKRTTLNRNRAIDYEADLLIKKNLRSAIPVYLFGLFIEDKIVSGLVVTKIKDEMRVMFGAKEKFPDVRGGVGGVLEMEMLRYCFERQLWKISHGISTNPAGLLDSSGIFEFKSRYGFTPFPYGEWKTTFLLKPEIALSDMVFLTIRENKLCFFVLQQNMDDSINRFQSKLITEVHSKPLVEFVSLSRRFLGIDL